MFLYVERFGALVALVGIAVSIYAYVRGGEGHLSGYIMIGGTVLFFAGVIGQRIQRGLKRK
jgi:hypothetical protein